MTKDELIVKQQLEIEELKQVISMHEESFYEIRNYLNYPEQWSIRSPDFPKIAMKGIVRARQVIDKI